MAINYGSKYEIFNSVKRLKKQINIKNIEKNLYTKNLPHPDILIRTGGHQRLSNFMLWQLAYTELFFLKKLWPDFNSGDLKKIIKSYYIIKEILEEYDFIKFKTEIFTSLVLLFIFFLVLNFNFVLVYTLILLGIFLF